MPVASGKANVQSSDAGAGQCPQCTQYREILGDTLQDLLEVHRFSNSMSTASKNQWNLDMRRASTFNLLHEAAVIKETASPATPPPASITECAQRELDRLRALPPTSHKWTWGECLTEADGRLTGEVSSPSFPTSHGQYEEVPAEVSLPVLLRHSSAVPYLANPGHLVYDPLAIPSCGIPLAPKDSAGQPSSALTLASPELPAYTQHHLAKDWSSASDDDNLLQSAQAGSALADVVAASWLSAGDEDVAAPAPAHAIAKSSSEDESAGPAAPASAHAVAQSWSEDESAGPAPVPSAPALAHAIAQSWSEDESAGPAPALVDDTTQFDEYEDPQRSCAAPEDWSSASDQETPAAILAEDWSSDRSSGSDSRPVNAGGRSNTLHPHFQFGVSPARITLDLSHNSFSDPFFLPNMSQDPSTSSLVTNARRYGPEHFAHLQDDMFEEEESDEEAEDSG
ncbi:hypothetical protein BYT27DRAFT_7249330 [Phlegmacium glaucopus]|nr:hypothetical protein BYT27DRAFT_7249330 [Phlegmacium glaucopus]